MSESGQTSDAAGDLALVETVVRAVATTAVAQETYFGELDAAVGDGDFGYSLARGFEKLLEGWEGLDRTDAGTFLTRTAMVLTSRIGGTSGPIWGTAFLRAGTTAKGRSPLTGEDAVAMLRAAAEGIKARGNSDVGDKTLLDALVPATEELASKVAAGAGRAECAAAFAATARSAAEATKGMLATRGRASYTGERSRDSVDAGAMGLAVIAHAVAEALAAQPSHDRHDREHDTVRDSEEAAP